MTLKTRGALGTRAVQRRHNGSQLVFTRAPRSRATATAGALMPKVALRSNSPRSTPQPRAMDKNRNSWIAVAPPGIFLQDDDDLASCSSSAGRWCRLRQWFRRVELRQPHKLRTEPPGRVRQVGVARSCRATFAWLVLGSLSQHQPRRPSKSTISTPPAAPVRISSARPPPLYARFRSDFSAGRQPRGNELSTISCRTARAALGSVDISPEPVRATACR